MIIIVTTMLAFAIGAAIAGWVLLTTDWHRVLTIASGRPDPRRAPGADERWRRVHIDADARAPFTRPSRPR